MIALSQKEVASLADIDRGQYSRIETNKVEPSLSSVKKIALTLQVDVEDFFKKKVRLLWIVLTKLWWKK